MKTRLALLLLTAIVVIPSRAWCADDTPVPPATTVKRVSVEEYDQRRKDTNNVVLDVRSKEEFKTGHIPGALNIDINSPAFAEKVAALDKTKPYLVNCAVGMRSARACKKMEGMGFRELYNLAPGFDGWKKAGKPVEK